MMRVNLHKFLTNICSCLSDTMRLKYNIFILLISTLTWTHGRKYFEDEEFASVEDETDYREGRILWPYPLKQNETEGNKNSNLKTIEELLKGIC